MAGVFKIRGALVVRCFGGLCGRVAVVLVVLAGCVFVPGVVGVDAVVGQVPFEPVSRMVAAPGSSVGYVDGPIADARFSSPTDIVADLNPRYLYVSDTGNDAIRQIDLLQGRTSTLVQGGLIVQPTELSLGRDGALYVVVDPRTPESPPGCQAQYTPGVDSNVSCGQFYLEKSYPTGCGCWQDDGSGDEKIVRIEPGKWDSTPAMSYVAEWGMWQPRGIAPDESGTVWMWDVRRDTTIGGSRAGYPEVSSISNGSVSRLLQPNNRLDFAGGDLQFRPGTTELWVYTNIGADGYYMYDPAANLLVPRLVGAQSSRRFAFSTDSSSIVLVSGKSVQRIDIATGVEEVLYNDNVAAGFSGITVPRWSNDEVVYVVNQKQNRVEAIDLVPGAQRKERAWANLAGSSGSTFGLAEDPVNTATGNLTDSSVDLPAPSGMFGMDVTRTYNSLGALSGVFGFGWSSSLDWRMMPYGSNDADDSDVNFFMADGRVLRFVNTATGQWATPPGLSGTLVWVSDHYELGLLSGERFVFDSSGRVVSHSDGNGQVATYTWSTGGMPLGLAHELNGTSSGYSVAFTDGDSDGRIDQAVASDGRIVDYSYDSQFGRLVAVSDPHTASETGYGVSTYTLDEAGRVVEIGLAQHGSVSNTRVTLEVSYDEMGRVASQVSAEGDTLTFAYDSALGVTTLTTGHSGDVTLYHHDTSGRLIGITDAEGAELEKSWDDRDQMVGVVGRSGEEFGYTYDTDGRLIQRVSPDPVTGVLPGRVGGPGSAFPTPGSGDGWSVEAYGYVAAGDPRVADYTNGAGEVTHYTYDGAEQIPSSVTLGWGTAVAATTTYVVDDDAVSSVTDPDGVKTCFDYDTAGRLSAQRTGCDSVGELVTSFGYDAAGRLVWRRDPAQQPAGATWQFSYDGMGRVLSEQKPDASTVTYTYDPVTGGHSRTDELGETTTVVVEHGVSAGCGSAGSRCRVETTTAPGDGTVPQLSQAVFDRSGDLVESRTSPDGGVTWHTTTYVYGALARLVSVTGPTGLVTSFGYDDDGNMTHRAQGADAFDAGSAAVTEFDKLGRVTSVSEPPDDTGRVTTETTYDRAGRPVLEVIGAGSAVEQAVRNEYRADGRISLRALNRADLGSGVEATTEYSYSPAGRVTCVKTLVDHLTSSFRFEATDYDTAGRPVRTRTNRVTVSGCGDSPGDSSKWSINATGFDTGGRVAWTQTPLQYAAAPADGVFNANFVTVYGYDAVGRLVSRSEPDPANPATATVTSRSCFNARGEVTRVADAAGQVTAFSYFPSGQLAEVTDPRAMAVAAADPCSLVASSPTLGTTRYRYDGEGNRVERIGYDNTGTARSQQWTYDPAGQMSTHVDELGRVETTGNIVVAGKTWAAYTTTGSASDPAVASGSSLRTRYTFTYPSGRTKALVDQQFDTANVMVSSYTATMAYDALGAQVSVRGVERDEVAGVVVSDESVLFGRDRAGNVTSVTYPGGEQAAYVWDVGGRQVDATIPSGARFRYRYGPSGLVDGVDLWQSGVWLPLASYSYDGGGHKVGEVLLGGLGATRSWGYSAASGYLAVFEQVVRDAQGVNPAVASSRWETTWGHTGRVAGDCVNVTGAAGCGGSDRQVAYSYDPAGQLLEAQVTNPHGSDVDQRSYTYGNRGERLSETMTDGSVSVSSVYSYDDALQVVSVDPDNAAASTYSYDAAGRRVSRSKPGAVTGYRYDARGLLVGVGSVNIDYDPVGLRSGNVFYDYSGRDSYPRVSMAGTVASSFRFDWGNGFIGVGVNDDTATIFTYGFDPYGTITDTVDTATASRYYTGPFGDHATGPDPLMYRGDLTTTGTDLDYLLNRYYDPQTGTFTTQDPLDGVTGTPTLTNPYHYVDNDPLNKVDPLGLRPTDGDLCAAGPMSYGGASPRKVSSSFTPQHGRGTVRVGLYIPTETAGFPGVDALRSHGDDRGPCPYADLSRYRAVATVDYEAGRVEFRINPSCGLGGPPGDCHDPLPIIDDFGTGARWFQRLPIVVGDSNRVGLDVRSDGSIYFRWAIMNSDKRAAAPAIDGSVTLHAVGSGSVCMDYHRDGYPALEAYQYLPDQAPRDLLNQGAAWNADRGLLPLPFTDKDGSTCISDDEWAPGPIGGGSGGTVY